MYNPTDKMCEERERLIGLLDAQLGFRPASAAWRDALHDLEYEVEGLLAREDNEVLGTRCSRFDAPMGPGQCDTIRRLRGYLPRLFDEARAAHPDIAFMGYLRLSATLRRWARGAGDAL